MTTFQGGAALLTLMLTAASMTPAFSQQARAPEVRACLEPSRTRIGSGKIAVSGLRTFCALRCATRRVGRTPSRWPYWPRSPGCVTRQTVLQCDPDAGGIPQVGGGAPARPDA